MTTAVMILKVAIIILLSSGVCIQILYVCVCVVLTWARYHSTHEKWIVGEAEKMEIGVRPPCVYVCFANSSKNV